MSVETYHRMGELGMLGKDVELLRGIIVKKVAKSPLHEFVSQTLLERLMAALPPGYTVRPERPLTTPDSEPEPDIAVVQGVPADWLHAHPAVAQLAIEVSISTHRVDEKKAEIYAETGVVEYWLVLPEKRRVDLFRDPSPDGYATRTTLRDGDILSCTALPAVQIAVSENK